MLAESFSDGMVSAMDPLDLYRNKKLAHSKHIYFVSISGNTVANVNIAKTAKKTTAITARSASRLAMASDCIIPLDFQDSGVFTAGSISFLDSALTCISLVKKITTPPAGLFLKAKKDAKKTRLTARIFVLGNMFTYPVAMYCAAKFYEVMGSDVHYCRMEQFSHMELFSSRKGDTVIIFEEKNRHNEQLGNHLRDIGINVVHHDVPSEELSKVVYCIFFSQMISLYQAKMKRKKDCHFVTAKNIRNVSNNMIY